RSDRDWSSAVGSSDLPAPSRQVSDFRWATSANLPTTAAYRKSETCRDGAGRAFEGDGKRPAAALTSRSSAGCQFYKASDSSLRRSEERRVGKKLGARL